MVIQAISRTAALVPGPETAAAADTTTAVLASTPAPNASAEAGEGDDAPLALAPPALWIDRGLASALQGQRTPVDVGWLKAPFRIETKAESRAGFKPTLRPKPVAVAALGEDEEGWLVARDVANSPQGEDWLVLR